MAYKRIMVGIDGGFPAVSALADAILLASVGQAAVRAISVLGPALDPIELGGGRETLRRTLHLAREKAEAALTRAQDLFVLYSVAGETALVHSTDEGVSTAILEEARAWNADLMVLGTHSQSTWDRLIVGSTAVAVLRRTTIPLLIVPARNEHMK